jgi:Tfp pilus assembly protein PilV
VHVIAIRKRIRLADERGMSLIELLVAMPFTLVLLGATVMMMIVSMRQSANVTDRVEANQRGRTTMERVIRQLRSQVCPATTGAAITSATDSSVQFYVDLSGGASNPERHTLTYDSTAGSLTEYDDVGTGTWPSMTWPGTPTRTSVLHSNISTVSGTPFFQYYGFASDGSISATPFTTPVSSTNLSKIVRVSVNFVSQPRRTQQAARYTTFQSEADNRTADPNDPTKGPRCL